MIRIGHAAAAALMVLAAACSGADDTRAPGVSADEQRALAEAREMIPADELPQATPTPAETATNDQ